MKKTFTILMALFVMVPFASACGNENVPVEQSGNYTEPLYIESRETGEKHQFTVEVAATPATIMKGLMYRSAMDADHGMLFLFPTTQERNFWMKNTYIPLDIIFLTENNAIHHIHENARPLDETRIPSNGPVRNVLELNAGTAGKLGLQPGDMLVMGEASKPLAE